MQLRRTSALLLLACAGLTASAQHYYGDLDHDGQVTALDVALLTRVVLAQDTAEVILQVGLGPYVAAEAISLPAEVKLGQHRMTRLAVMLHPSTATMPPLTWRSLQPGVAEVDGDGIVKAKAPGKAQIVVETQPMPAGVVTLLTAEGTSSAAEATVPYTMLSDTCTVVVPGSSPSGSIGDITLDP